MMLSQWSLARAKEHCDALCRAAAAIEGRDRVELRDVYAVKKLLKPCLVETHAFNILFEMQRRRGTSRSQRL